MFSVSLLRLITLICMHGVTVAFWCWNSISESVLMFVQPAFLPDKFSISTYAILFNSRRQVTRIQKVFNMHFVSCSWFCRSVCILYTECTWYLIELQSVLFDMTRVFCGNEYQTAYCFCLRLKHSVPSTVYENWRYSHWEHIEGVSARPLS